MGEEHFKLNKLFFDCSSLPLTIGETSCNDLTFKCKNNKCISKVNPECDGTKDCEDGSDEENCGMSQSPYLIHQLLHN